ncbi:basic proline-rich protein-like [Caloenas nicobarica]|uniref:basic proline-rich protein-like n=1 Tax=Caloenas nicobarica TaxID=187106 RepID=UPI0032B7EDBD
MMWSLELGVHQGPHPWGTPPAPGPRSSAPTGGARPHRPGNRDPPHETPSRDPPGPAAPTNLPLLPPPPGPAPPSRPVRATAAPRGRRPHSGSGRGPAPAPAAPWGAGDRSPEEPADWGPSSAPSPWGRDGEPESELGGPVGQSPPWAAPRGHARPAVCGQTCRAAPCLRGGTLGTRPAHPGVRGRAGGLQDAPPAGGLNWSPPGSPPPPRIPIPSGTGGTRTLGCSEPGQPPQPQTRPPQSPQEGPTLRYQPPPNLPPTRIPNWCELVLAGGGRARGAPGALSSL